MSDISLLMAGILTAGQTTAPNDLPKQPVIQSNRAVQESKQEQLSQIFPPAEITPPEFVQPDGNFNVTTSNQNKEYRNLLTKIKQKSHSQISSILAESQDSQTVATQTQKPESKKQKTGILSPPTSSSPSSPPTSSSPPSPHPLVSNPPIYPAQESDTQEPDNQMSQITSVSQLNDVQPSDWVFGALQSIVERYGCIPGATASTRAITRYEFAAGLNACLEQINEINNNKINTLNKEDLILLQRLQTEFQSELTQLQQRVATVEERHNKLQANQFSPTTRLFGQAIFSVQGTNSTDVDLFPRDGVPERRGQTNLTFADSVQLTLATSFTGRDLLLTGLSAGNLGSSASLLSTNMGRLGFESNTENNLQITDLSYRFLLSDNLGVVVGTAGVNPINTFRGINPLEGSGDGAISQFGQRNPILSIGNGTGGIGFDWQISDRISLQGVYSAEIPGFPGNSQTGGLFGGRFTAGAQLTLAPTDNIDIGVHYLYSHSPDELLGTSIGDAQLISPFAQPTAFNTHAVGATVAWRVNPNLQLGGWGGFSSSKPVNLSGSVETTNWMVFAAFPNLLRSGNLGGILVGQPPKITSSTLPDGFNFPNFSNGGTPGGRSDTSLHVELFYRAQLNEHLALTPGIFVIFNPDHNAANDPLVVGALRATFRF
ncbi:iron uptake porin [Nostocaceae cyanobacterium CENA369]|uniref:Iron uptake porin n=1 Tax=Dendronalium phyllosphericum CENA369 TaxID=1725256 RepID=A0A8J7I036_9NOST|nr:iron uptake porin [Dendronalium phyllosphericum]MBH8573480.1 iron uptake porin [Dendronalium phyllosphericum CENA369]